MTHVYTLGEAISCLAGKRVLFIGDSMVYDIFAAFVRALHPLQRLDGKDRDAHANLTIHGIRLSFVWDPYFNGTGFDRAFDVRKEAQIPALTIIGTGLWYARNQSERGFDNWKNTVDAIAMMSQVEGLRGRSTSDLVVMLPVLEPDWSRFSNDRRLVLQDMVSRMNSYLMEVYASNEANIALSFNEMISSTTPETTPNAFGNQFSDILTAAQTRVLFNLRCNDQLSKTPPFDRTCCFNYPAPNAFQSNLFIFVLVVLPVIYLLQSYDGPTKFLPSESVLQALLKFALVVLFAYSADRTHLFGKQSKRFSFELFIFSNISVSLLGYFLRTTTDQHLPFLNNGQLSEWKGWLVIVILINQYFGISGIQCTHGFMRVFMGMYFFITSYEHTLYFLKTEDLGVQRIFSVLLRLNLLNVVLAYVMNTSYQMYHIAPLLSFWFSVVWMTLRIGHGRNGEIRYLGVKLVVSGLAVIVFTKMPGVLDEVFEVLRMIGRINWDADEWQLRVGLDMWLVYAGMIVAVIFTHSHEITNLPNWQPLRKFAVTVSLLAMPISLLFQATQGNDTGPPFTSICLILSFIVLRNSTARLRNIHSTVFAWIGQYSLEIFILQFHLWLAGDSNGILQFVGPSNWRSVNLLIGTTIFLFICWKIGTATGIIADWILGIRGVYVPTTNGDTGDIERNQKKGANSEIQRASGKDEISGTIVEDNSFGENLGRVKWVYWDDMRVRFATIVAALWLLNLVCPLYFWN